MRRALTLMETLVATCIATMLLLEVGSSFLIFRQMNNESTSDAKSELKVLEIKDYVTNNIDKFIDEALGATYFRVAYDKIDSKNYKFVYDGGIYVLQSSGEGKTVTLDTVLPDQTINHESIISFKLPEEYHDQPIYLKVKENNRDVNKQVTKLSPDDTLYYSELAGKSITNIDNNISNDLAEYKNNTLYINGEQIFTNLPFKNVEITLGFEKQEVDTYTIAKVDDEEYEPLPITIEVENPQYGMINIKDVDLDRHTVTLEAHNYYEYNLTGLIEKIRELRNKEDVDIKELLEEIKKVVEDVGEIVEDVGQITQGEIPEIEPENVYTFEGWFDSEDDKTPISDEFTYKIDYLNNSGKKYIAKFSEKTNPVITDLENVENIEEALKNTMHAKRYSAKNEEASIVTKKVYVLKCTIEYEDKNGVKTTLPFTAGLFEKYLPEIYRGGN